MYNPVIRSQDGATEVVDLEARRKAPRVALFYAITSLYWFSLYTYVPTLSPYARSIGASYRMVGMIIGSYGFIQLLLRIPLGLFSDNTGRRKVFVVLGVLFSLLSAVGLYVSRNPFSLLVSRSLSGVAASMWVVFTVLFVGYFDSGDAPKAIGLINSFTSLGQICAMLLGGWVAGRFGETAPFVVGACGAAMGLVLSLGATEVRSSGNGRLDLRGFVSVVSDPHLLIVSLLAVVVQLLTFGTVYGFTPVIAKSIGASDFETGVLATLAILPTVFVAAMSGTVFRRVFGERNTIAGSFILIAASCFYIPYARQMMPLYVAQVIGGIGRGTALPLLMGLSIRSVPVERRATAMGFFQAVYAFGMFIGPVLVGFLSDIVGLSWGFWAVGLLGVAGALLTLLLVGEAARAKAAPAALDRMVH
jgi:MFS family permease